MTICMPLRILNKSVASLSFDCREPRQVYGNACCWWKCLRSSELEILCWRSHLSAI